MGKSCATGYMEKGVRITDPPDWFIDHCVKTSSQLASQALRVAIRDAGDSDEELNPDVENTYVLDAYMYEDLRKFLDKPSGESATDPVRGCQFTNNALFLHLPKRENQDKIGECDFLSAVVERFALDAGADLVCLRAHDLADLSDAIKILRQDEPTQQFNEDRVSDLKEKEALTK